MASEDDDFEAASENFPADSRTGNGDGKRPFHGEEGDQESQQSILKWMRQVPGPLHDVMKKQAKEMDSQHSEHRSEMTITTSQGFSMTIRSVFDQGPWVDMCQFLGMKVSPGEPNGGVKMSNLNHTVFNICSGDNAPTKAPQVLVLIKSMRYVEEEIMAVLHDPTGTIEGYLHRELVEQIGPAFSSGTALLLQNVSVFTPTDAPVSGKRTSYLNITPRNLRRVFIAQSESSSSASYEVMVEQFNQEKHDEGPEEDGFDDFEINQSDGSHHPGRNLLHQDAVRNTSAELAFLSQRQVVHRNPPMRPDPDTTGAASSKKKGKRGKKASASTGDGDATGLGRWQWSKLLKKSTEESAALSSRKQETEAASSRLANLISRQISHKSSERSEAISSSRENTSDAASKPKKRSSVGVTFAPGTAFNPSPTPQDYENRNVTEISSSLSPLQAVDPPSEKPVVLLPDPASGGDWEDDDDDDW